MCSMISINSSSGCSKIWSDLSNLAWSLVSNQSTEDEVSEVRVSTSFLMCYFDNFFGPICCFPLNFINSSFGCSNFWLDRESVTCNSLSNLFLGDGCSEVSDNTNVESRSLSVVKYVINNIMSTELTGRRKTAAYLHLVRELLYNIDWPSGRLLTYWHFVHV